MPVQRAFQATIGLLIALVVADAAFANDPGSKPPVGNVRIAVDAAHLTLRTAKLPDALTDEERWHANSEMRLRGDGNIPGQLRSYDAAGNLTPIRARLFFVQKGQVVGRAQSDEKGNFQAMGLKEGVYSVIVASPDGFGAAAIKVLPFVGEEAIPAPKVKSIAGPRGTQVSFPVQGGIVLSVSLVPKEDLSIMAQLVTRYIPSIGTTMAGVTPGQSASLLPSRRSQRLVEALGDGEVLAAAAILQPGAPRVRARNADLPEILPDEGPWHANHEMRLRADGNLPGQLRAFDAAGNLTPVRARLFFVQKGQVVGRAQSDEKGSFQAMGLRDGVYSVIAAGPDGFGAMSMRIMPFLGEDRPDAPKVKSISGPAAQKVSYQGPITFTVTMISPTDFTVAFQLASQQIPQLASQLSSLLQSLGVAPALANAAGAAAASAAGGAVGGAAGGGIGGLVAAGAGGLVAAAASSGQNQSGASTGGTGTTTTSDATTTGN